MMGRLSHDQEQFFYSFRLEEAVSGDHPVREIAAVLDLSWVHSELAPYYSRLGRAMHKADKQRRRWRSPLLWQSSREVTERACLLWNGSGAWEGQRLVATAEHPGRTHLTCHPL
jgi:hypothetical protein